MSYFANTIRDHLKDQITRFRTAKSNSRKMIIMVPAMPETATLSVANSITNYCLQDENLNLTLKIASALTNDWSPDGQKRVAERGWEDKRGNLTYYRNLSDTPGQNTLALIVLCGADRVTDAAGLADFHTCDPDSIWHTDMRASFQSWTSAKLKASGFDDYNNADLKTIDRILKPLLDCGRGDLLQISTWLEDLDLTNAGCFADITQAMLMDLKAFGVPVLARFPLLKQKNKQLSPYIIKSAEFYNYSLFIETRQRDKAIKAIDKMLEHNDGQDLSLLLDDELIRGPYESGESFLNGLKKFIETDDQTERKRLMACDFIVIWDQILKFKLKETPKDKNSVRKLSGSPVEVLLTAAWMTLHDFYSDNQMEEEIKIEKISIKAYQFKHDIDSGDDAEDNQEHACKYLKRLIGGIDPFITQHIDLSNSDGSEIKVECTLLTDCKPKYSKTAEPVLEFDVEISSPTLKTLKRKFGWRLPEHHMYRLSIDLLKRANDAADNLSALYKLPVFHLPYYEELLRASADEEIRRVLLHSIRDESGDDQVITNLLGGDWAHQNDPLSGKLKTLADKYNVFIENAVSDGVLSAIFDGRFSWTDLRKAYDDAFNAAADLDNINQSSMIGMLIRAFLIIGKRPSSLAETWYANDYEASGVATILHPSVLEMLEAQVIFQSRCFNYAANKELSTPPRKDAFRLYAWISYIDLSSIQSPIVGLLYNESKNLTANVRGQELIHRIGSPESPDTPLSTRLLLQYNDSSGDDDSLSDSEMFKETSESKLLLRLMHDYFDLHPHARDGLSVAVFRNKDIQPVISAVHAYLKELARQPSAQRFNERYILSEDRKRPYAMSVTLFTESQDETDVSSWVQQWKERWEAAETENKYDLYRRCKFSVAHRIVEIGENNNLTSFHKLVNEQFEADIAVFYDFINAGSCVNDFEQVEPFDITSRDLKFPILEKACCSVNNPAEKYRRKKIVSNRQFALAASHAKLMHSLRSGSHQTGTIVVGSGDFTPWRSLFDCLHKKAEWVICIDSNMDERLIKEPMLDTDKAREIIGFGSGVGTHGEDNYTISTEQFSLADIHTRIRASIQQLYVPDAGWSKDECDAITKGILNIAPELSGLSLVRATGVRDGYIRDFMAHALSRKLLIANDQPLCETLVSLDAYRHWFDLSDNMRRPDLMWMRVYVGQNQRLHLKMKLIECKLGNESSEHINKAKSQIDNGLRVLSNAFSPIDNTGDAPYELESKRPDRRYWWMQLHRLIASKAEVDKGHYPEALGALERLAEGDFEISWSASIFAFWINKDTDIQRIGYWSACDCPAVTANAYAIGGGYVRQLFLAPEIEPIDWQIFSSQGDEIVGEDDVIIPPVSEDDYTPWEPEGTHDEIIDDDSPAETSEKSEVSTDPFTATDQISSAITPPDIAGVEQAVISPTAALPAAPDKAESISAPASLGRILLGNSSPNGQPVYWEFKHPDLANRHLLIFGSSGQGKTYAIQSILYEMSKFQQNSLIIDYTNGFLPNQLEPIANNVLKPKQHVVHQEPLPINPFLPQVADNGGIVISENANAVAKRIAGLFNSVYDIGSQQYSILHRAVMDGVESMQSGMNLDYMLTVIEALADDKQFKASAQSLHNKLRPFVLDRPFSSGECGFDWDHIFLEQEPICNIFQLAGLDMYSGRLITEFILWDLYGHLQSKGKKTDPKVIVLDEVQNLDHKEGSPLSKYLREGRKFGLSLILATQTMSNMKKDERDRMFNAEHKLFFKPADTELKAFADIAALATRQKTEDWIRKLASLSKGECYSIGRILDQSGDKLVSRAVKIRITPLEERNSNG